MRIRMSNNMEVAHVWARRTQNEGRGSHFWFENDTIYSYGRHFPIARWVNTKHENVIFFTKRSYSHTTSKHMSYVHRAIPNETKIFYFNDISSNHHSDNIKELLQDAVNELNRAARSVKYTESIVISVNSQLINIKEYAHLFLTNEKNIKEIEDQISDLRLKIDALLPKIAQQKENFKIAEQKRIAKNKAKWEIEKQEFFLYKRNYCNSYGDHDLIRLSKDEKFIETSRNVTVTVEVAKRYYQALIDRLTKGKSVRGLEIDQYQTISCNGVLTIGCHKLLMNDIHVIAEKLGIK